VDGLGVAALLFAALSWAAGSLQAGAHEEAWPVRGAATHLLAGGGGLLLASVVVGEIGAFDPRAVSLRSVVALAYLTTFGTLVAYSAFVWLLSRTDVSRVASHAYVNPVVAVLLGATLGGEALTPATLLGAGLIVLAVVAVVVARGRGRVPAERAEGAERAERDGSDPGLPRAGGSWAPSPATAGVGAGSPARDGGAQSPPPLQGGTTSLVRA
jgi:drug/metabolite transporter (DMT)-like permease